MKVRKDWWKNFFNKTYLITDARSVCNPLITSKEVDLLEKFLNLNKGDEILDFCGGYGRHSLELARRGYCNLTVLDFSDYQIKLGKRLAKREGLNIKFLKRDARVSKLRDESFSAIFIMANSFGYFLEEKENLRILREVYRLLKKGGRFLLDLANAEYIKNILQPQSWHEANKDIIVCRERELKNNIIKVREIVISKKRGLLRDGFYCERLYTKEKISRLLKSAGFEYLSIRKNISLYKNKKDCGLMSSRMIIKASKPRF